MKTILSILLLLSGALASVATPQSNVADNSREQLRKSFLNPPDSIKVGCYYYWVNEIVDPKGVKADLQWMKDNGITLAFLATDIRNNVYGENPWKEEYFGDNKFQSPLWWQNLRTALKTAGKLGIEMGIFNCPGWSQSGGPWVKPEQAMKRLVWSETRVKGGKLSITLPEPNRDERWYADICVLAVKANPADKTMEELGATFTTSDSLQQPYWVQYQLKKPTVIKALSIKDGNYRSIWAAQPAPVTKWLEVSDDGVTFRRVCGIPHGSVGWQTIDIEPTRGRYFRITFERKPGITPQLKLYTTPRINHAEEKAGFASPSDMMDFLTTAEAGEAIQLTDVIDVTDRIDDNGVLSMTMVS